MLTQKSAKLLTVGLVGTSAALILIATQASSPNFSLALAALPAACLLICSGIWIARLGKQSIVTASEAMPGYLLLGVVGFAAWLALGLLCFTARDFGGAIAELSPVITAMALPALFMGLVIWKKAESGDKRVSVSGMSVAFLGIAILLAGLLVAWPGPGRVVPLAAFDALLLLTVALGFDLPAAYIPAAFLAGLAWLIGVHTWPWWHEPAAFGSQRMFDALSAPDNGWLLLPIAVLLAVGGMLQERWRPNHARVLGGLGLFFALVSLGIANTARIWWWDTSLLDPTCFDLLFGGAFLLIWLSRRDAGRQWAAIATCLPLLASEVLALQWGGQRTDDPIMRFMPAMPIAICAAVPILGLILWRVGKCRVRPGVIVGLGLLETAGALLLSRWAGAGEFDQCMLALFGHTTTAWATFAIGALMRTRFERVHSSEPATPTADSASATATAAKNVEYQAPATPPPRWFAQRTRPVGPILDTVYWTILAGTLATLACAAVSLHYPWQAAFAALMLSVLAAVTACWADAPNGLYIAGALFNFAGTIALFTSPLNRYIHGDQMWSANVIFLCIGGAASLVLDRTVFATRDKTNTWIDGFHAFAGWLALLGLALFGQPRWIVIPSRAIQPDAMTWAALAAVAGLFAVRLLDRRTRDPLAGIYLTGLLGTTFAIGCLATQWAMSLTVWAMAFGMYGISTATIGWAALRFDTGGEPRRRWARGWLVAASMILAAWALAGALHGDWSDGPRWLAIDAAIVAMAQPIGLALLSGNRRGIRQASLATLALAMISFAWAIMPGGSLAQGLDAASAAIAAAALFAIGTTIACRFVSEQWRSSVQPVLMAVVGAMALATVAIVASELTDYVQGISPSISRLAVVGIECELLIGCATAITAAAGSFALSPPLKSACVWSAEALAVLAFAHLRVTEPWLFSHRIERYWPIIVLTGAFVLLAAGLALQRRGRGEVGRPLEYSAIGWPAVVICGYWLHPAAVEFSAVLWIVGVLYAIVAAARRSFWFSLIALACMNAGMWVVFSHHPQLAFFAHPQLWVIPAALCVLAAIQVHHAQLGSDEIRAARYVCLSAIYLSSTADILLNGVVAAPWLPMVLAALAIAGVLAGILWHIRPFLYLGTMFLLIAVLMMIWTAQQNLHWTWLWYVAGLAAGIGLLTLFGLFEKRHEQMTRMLQSIRQWQ